MSAATALAGIGDDINSAIKEASNVQFKPATGKIMQVTCTIRGLYVVFSFIDGCCSSLCQTPPERKTKMELTKKTLALTGKILVAPFILALFVLNTDWALIALCALYVTPFLVIWGGLKLLAYIRERLTVRAYNKRERKRETKREEFSPVQAKRAKPVEEQIADYYEGY